MTTYVFDGSMDVTIDNFDVANDQLVFSIDASDVALISDAAGGAKVTTNSGTTLTFSGLSIAALAGLDVIPADVLQFGTDGPDFLSAIADGSAIAAGAGNDSILGEAGNDVLFGNQGNDTIDGSDGGSDKLYSGLGDDSITWTAGANDDADTTVIAYGGFGTDDIDLNDLEGAATVYGGNEANTPDDLADDIDVLTMVDGASAVIYGNGGNDEITVTGDGDATVFGGLGDDIINVTADTASVVGGLGADEIDVTLNGGDGNDATVYGGNGINDSGDQGDSIDVSMVNGQMAYIYGNAGNDDIALSGAGGEAHVFGGQGDDTISADGSAAATADVGDGTEILGGKGADVVNVSTSGTDAAVTVAGGNGIFDTEDEADVVSVDVSAAAHTATVYGNGGDDEINITGNGSASVFGGQGDDTITVTPGADDSTHELTGGAGEDDFVFTGASYQLNGAGDAVTTHITDLNFDNETIEFATAVAQAVDLTGTNLVAAGAGDLKAAAAEAIDQAADPFVDTTEIAVLFNFDGKTYVTAGSENGTDVVTVVDLVEVTGYTGDFDLAAFA